MPLPVQAAPPPAAPAPPSPSTYGFAGVRLGATLDALHAARPKAACSPARNDVVDCTAQDQPIGGGWFARDLTYRYAGGRLTQIRFHTSIDGFAFVMARLKQDFGPPASVRRDEVSLYGHRFPHEAFTWRNGRSTIELSDPALPDQLVVTITLDGVKANTGAA